MTSNSLTTNTELDRNAYLSPKARKDKSPVSQSKSGGKRRSSTIFLNKSDKAFHQRPWDVFTDLIPEEKCHLTHVSLFSGCGGADLGLHQAGFRTVFANDIFDDACATYSANLGDIYEGDIRALRWPSNIAGVDLLTAGFPCQPFSNAGSRRGLEDQRGTLYEAAVAAVAHFLPRAVLFENVRGILSFRKGRALLVGDICASLDRLGYDCIFTLLNAADHNVAQNRLRVFVVGIHRERGAGTFAFPVPVNEMDLSLGATILDIPKDAPNQDELMRLNPQAIHIGSMVPEGGSWKNIPYEKLPPRLKKISDNIERYRWPNFYRRFHRNEVAGTVTAAFKPENAGVWHPIEGRIMSVREIARIQSFPDWFVFEGKTVKSKYVQIGNAIPPRLAYEIGRNIARALAGENLRTNGNFVNYCDFLASGRPLKAKDNDIVYISDERRRN